MPPLPDPEDESSSGEIEPAPASADDPRTIRLNKAGVLAVRSPKDYYK